MKVNNRDINIYVSKTASMTLLLTPPPSIHPSLTWTRSTRIDFHRSKVDSVLVKNRDLIKFATFLVFFGFFLTFSRNFSNGQNP